MSKTLKQHLSLLLAGALYALGFPTEWTVSLFITPMIGIAIFIYYLERRRSAKSYALLTLYFSLGYYLTGYYWIPYTITEFGQIPNPFNHLLGIFFSPFLAPQIWGFVIIYKLVNHLKLNRPAFASFQEFVSPALFWAFIYASLEYLVPQQFPAHLGHSWLIFAPYLGFAQYLGSPFYTFISFLIAYSAKDFILTRKYNKTNLIVIGIFLLGNFLNPIQYNPPKDSTFNLRIVQANIGSLTKVQSEGGNNNAYDLVSKKYYNLSIKDIKPGTDLIVWPETALPGVLTSKLLKENKIQFPDFVKQVIETTKAEMIVGGYDTAISKSDLYFEDQYNSIYHLGPNGSFKNVYHKHLLLPFGETLPFGPLNLYLSRIIPGVSFFAKGTKFPIFTTAKGVRILPIICYEILAPDFINGYLNKNKRPHFLLNLTNDSWYGDTAEPYQHLFLSKWRALETNLPIIRATNTGVTSVIFPNGTESEQLKIGEERVLDLKLNYEDTKPTYYQRYGFCLTFIVMLMIVLIAGIIRKKSSMKKNLLSKVHENE